jgi:hypothetical protein
VEAEAKAALPGAEGEEAGRKKETMELFPQSAGLGAVQEEAVPDAARYWTTLLFSSAPFLALFRLLVSCESDMSQMWRLESICSVI